MGPGVDLIGHRLTIRLHDPEGGFRDIVGVLESTTTLRRRDNSIATFNPERIAIWREIPIVAPRAGHGAPLSARIREIELAANETWKATHENYLGGWLLRASGQFTLRANSVLPLGEPPFGNPGIEIDEAIEKVIAFYNSHNLKPVFHIPLPTYCELDDLLEKKGWEKKVTVAIMVSDLDPIPMPQISAGNWQYSDSPTPQWLALQADEALAHIMTRSPATYTQLMINDAVVAVGRAAIHDGWVVLSRLFVDPKYRSQGFGRATMVAMLNNALLGGATKAMLQVDSGNDTAISLYENLGFNQHHTYTYRILQPSKDNSC